jgi:hypothetical protein
MKKNNNDVNCGDIFTLELSLRVEIRKFKQGFKFELDVGNLK